MTFKTFYGKKFSEAERKSKYRFLRLLGYPPREARRLRHFPVGKLVAQAARDHERLCRLRGKDSYQRFRDRLARLEANSDD